MPTGADRLSCAATLTLSRGGAGTVAMTMSQRATWDCPCIPARPSAFWSVVIGLVCTAAVAGVLPHMVGDTGPSALRRSASVDLPGGADALLSKTLGADHEAFWARKGADGVTALNKRHDLRARFDGNGVVVHAGDGEFRLSLRSVGYGSAQARVRNTSPHVEKNRVEYRRDGLTEWYINGPLGLEHGVTLVAPPASETDHEPLTLTFGLSGSLLPILENGAVGLRLGSSHRYGGLVAFDAKGRELPAHLELAAGTMRMLVDDHDAQYPLTIDPLIQQGKLTASDGATSDQFGTSVAVSGGHARGRRSL